MASELQSTIAGLIRSVGDLRREGGQKKSRLSRSSLRYDLLRHFRERNIVAVDYASLAARHRTSDSDGSLKELNKPVGRRKIQILPWRWVLNGMQSTGVPW